MPLASCPTLEFRLQSCREEQVECDPHCREDDSEVQAVLAFPGSSCRSTKYAIMPPIIARKIGRRNHQLLLGLCISNDLYCQLSLLIVGIGGVTHRSSRCRLMTLTCSWMVVIAGICPSPLTREIHSQRHLSLAFLVPRPFTTRSRICGGLHPSVCGGYHAVCNFLYSNLEILVVELQLSDSHGMLYRTGSSWVEDNGA